MFHHNVIVVGTEVGIGAREHELGRQLAMTDGVEKVLFTGANAMDEPWAVMAERVNPKHRKVFMGWVEDKLPNLVVIGPEKPLVNGYADELRTAGKKERFKVFGPGAAGARFEGDRAWAHNAFVNMGINRPETHIFHDYESAAPHLKTQPDGSYVIKANKIASGKGTELPDNFGSADEILQNMFSGWGYGGAGKETVVIEQRLHSDLPNPEVSSTIIIAGGRLISLGYIRDFKRFPGSNKNTGGIASYGPLTEADLTDRQANIIEDAHHQILDYIKAHNIIYRGAMTIDWYLADEFGGDPVLMEANVRFGNPQVLVQLPVLRAAGYAVGEWMFQAADGKLPDITIPRLVGYYGNTLTLGEEGYPGKRVSGRPIHGLDYRSEDLIIHHAGTKRKGEQVVTCDGRALNLTGIGETPQAAREAPLKALAHVGFEGMQVHREVGIAAG